MSWLCELFLLKLATVSVVSKANNQAAELDKPNRLAIHRLFNGVNHFYTTAEVEYRKVLKDFKFKDEKMPECGYLGKEAEGSVNIKETTDDGYSEELIMGYCSNHTQHRMVALHRFWQRNIFGDNIFTINDQEYYSLSTLTSTRDLGWVNRGILCYVYKSLTT